MVMFFLGGKGTYSRWVLIRGWALKRINTLLSLIDLSHHTSHLTIHWRIMVPLNLRGTIKLWVYTKIGPICLFLKSSLCMFYYLDSNKSNSKSHFHFLYKLINNSGNDTLKLESISRDKTSLSKGISSSGYSSMFTNDTFRSFKQKMILFIVL